MLKPFSLLTTDCSIYISTSQENEKQSANIVFQLTFYDQRAFHHCYICVYQALNPMHFNYIKFTHQTCLCHLETVYTFATQKIKLPRTRIANTASVSRGKSFGTRLYSILIQTKRAKDKLKRKINKEIGN